MSDKSKKQGKSSKNSGSSSASKSPSVTKKQIRALTPQEEKTLRNGGETIVRSSSLHKRRGTPVPLEMSKIGAQLAKAAKASKKFAGRRANSAPSLASVEEVEDAT